MSDSTRPFTIQELLNLLNPQAAQNDLAADLGLLNPHQAQFADDDIDAEFNPLDAAEEEDDLDVGSEDEADVNELADLMADAQLADVDVNAPRRLRNGRQV